MGNLISSIKINGPKLAGTLTKGYTLIKEKPMETTKNYGEPDIMPKQETPINEAVQNYQKPTVNETSVFANDVDGSHDVEKAINTMTKNAAELIGATDELKSSETYKHMQEEIVNNFNIIFDFLVNGSAIEGYTSDNVSYSTLQKAKGALQSLNGYIETYASYFTKEANEKLATVWPQVSDVATSDGNELENDDEVKQR